MRTILMVGTAARIWVGGSIMIHSLDELGVEQPYKGIHEIAVETASNHTQGQGFVEWFVTAFLDGVLGLIFGLLLIPVVQRVITPLAGRFTGKAA